jgi:uncharacterized protein
MTEGDRVIQTSAQTRGASHGRAIERPSVGERVAAIDMLRGLALCGILLIHVATFARPGAPPGFGYSAGPLDELILAALILFVEGKFFALFAMLFGLGFAVQQASAARRGVAFAPLFRRRLLILGLIGAAHVLLVWEGDILLLYAAMGLLLIPIRDAPPERLLRWAAGLLAAPLLLLTLAFGGLMLAQSHPESAARIRVAEAEFDEQFAASRDGVVARYASDDPLDAAAGRVRAYISSLPLLLVRAPTVLAMFLLGFAVGRLGELRDLDRRLPLLRRARAWGLGAGLVASLLVTLAYSRLSSFAALTALGFNQVLAGPALAIGYGAAFMLIASQARWGRLLAPLAVYGRVALSVYLLQSMICGLLFYGTGLGLVLAVAPVEALALAVLINVALIAASVAWLRRFRYGPVEWAWRSLTVGRAQPFLRDGGATVSPSHGSRGAREPRAALRRGTPFDGRRVPGPR